MPQETRIVGLDVAKSKVDACIHSLGLRLSAPSTPEGEAKLVAWLRANRVGRVAMEASAVTSAAGRKPCARPARGSGRRSEAGPPFRQGGRPAGQERSDRRRDDRPFAEAFPDDSAQPHIARVRARPSGSGPKRKDVQERIKQQRSISRLPSSLRPSPRSPRRCAPRCASSRPHRRQIKANPAFARRASSSTRAARHQTIAVDRLAA